MTPGHFGHRFLVRWVGWVQRRAVAVLVGVVLATVLAAVVTVSRIGINTDTTDMLSAELPFRRNLSALRQAFPQFSDVLSIVIEARTPDQAADAAERLAAALRAQTADFEDVFYPQGDAFFRRNGLLYLDLDDLQTLSDRVAQAQPLLAVLSRDPSLRGLAEVLALALDPPPRDPRLGATGDAAGPDANQTVAALAPVLDALAVAVEALSDSGTGAGQGQAHPLSWISLLGGKAPTAVAKRRFVTVKPRLDFASLQPAARAIEAVRQSARDLDLNERSGVRVRMTGPAILFQEELESVREGMGVAGLVSAILVVSLLALGLRSGPLSLATLATLGVGLIWTAGFAAVAVVELNLISVAFAVLFIGLSVDFGIHFALRYQEALVPGDPGAGNRIQALNQAVGNLGGPLTLCAVAAAIGFFAFLPTDYRGVSELGLISGVGMFIALFANLTVLPAILRLLPPGPANPLRHNAFGGRLQGLAAGRPRAVLAVAAALGVAGLFLLPHAGFDDDPLNLRDPGSESVSTLHDVISDPRVEPFSAVVLTQDLARARALARRLERLEEVASVVTLDSLVPDDQFGKLEIIDQMALFLTPVVQPRPRQAPPDEAELRQALATLHGLLTGVTGPLEGRARRLALALDRITPSGPALAALDRALLGGLPRRLEDLAAGLEAGPVTVDDLPDQLRRRYLSATGQARVEALPREDLRDPAARGRFVDALRRVAPAASGAAIIITEAGRAVIRAFGEAALIAVVLVSLLLFVLLGSLRDSVMVLIPLVLAATLTAAATVVFRIPFNFANVIVLPLLFGLGVAGGIHMVSRARQGGGAGLIAGSTPRAVLFSALTTIGSFCALALSSHRGTASMGILLTIAISLTMLSTLLVLPALLAVFPGARPGTQPGAKPGAKPGARP